MDSLTANPSGSIYNNNSGGGGDDVLGLVNQLKDREMMDFQNKANFMSDLSLRQEARMRSLFDPTGQGSQGGQPKNVVFQQDPNQITPFQKEELGIRREGLGLDRQRLAQQGKLGQEAIDVRGAQEKLNEQKNANIHEQKTADMQRKIDEANTKFGLAQQELDRKTKAGEDTLQSHKDLAAAIEERHKLELAHKDLQFEESKRLHDAQIKKMEEDTKSRSSSTTTTEVNPEGTKRTTTTERGTSSGTIKGIGRDGKEYDVPADKIDDWNKNHAQPGTEIKRP